MALAKIAAYFFSIDQQRKSTAAFRALQALGPVDGAHPHGVAAIGGYGGLGAGICHGFAHTMCNQIRRANGLNELRVDHPAAFLRKLLGFHDKSFRVEKR